MGFAKARISSNTSAAEAYENASPKPIAVATPAMICQSGIASPTGSAAWFSRVSVRSEFTETDVDSAHSAAGSSTSA